MYTLPPGMILVLRSCSKDFTAYNCFQYPKEVGATVTAPDFINTPECGHGLHGWRWGMGRRIVSQYLTSDSVWMVLEVPEETIINLGDKVKFPSGKIVFIGDKITAPRWLYDHCPDKKMRIINLHMAVNADDMLCGGDGANLTGGGDSVVVGGDDSTITVGSMGVGNAGKDSFLYGKHNSILSGGYSSVLTFYYKSKRDRSIKAKVGYVKKHQFVSSGLMANVPYTLDPHNKIVDARSLK